MRTSGRYLMLVLLFLSLLATDFAEAKRFGGGGSSGARSGSSHSSSSRSAAPRVAPAAHSSGHSGSSWKGVAAGAAVGAAAGYMVGRHSSSGYRNNDYYRYNDRAPLANDQVVQPPLDPAQTVQAPPVSNPPAVAPIPASGGNTFFAVLATIFSLAIPLAILAGVIALIYVGIKKYTRLQSPFTPAPAGFPSSAGSPGMNNWDAPPPSNWNHNQMGNGNFPPSLNNTGFPPPAINQWDAAPPSGWNNSQAGFPSSANFPSWDANGPQTQTFSSSAVMNASISHLPDGTEASAFLNQARSCFLHLQSLNSPNQLQAVSVFLTPAYFEELKSQISINQEIAQFHNLQLDLLGCDQRPGELMASVRFQGMVQESQSAPPQAFSEIWNFTRSANTPWLLAGIEQA